MICNLLKEGYYEYLTRLSGVGGIEVKSFDDLLKVLINRLDYFDLMGCRIADHGITSIPNCECTKEEAMSIFHKVLLKNQPSQLEADKFMVFMLEFFAVEYSKRGWAMQLHISVVRNQNTKLYKQLGPDSGIDSTGDNVSAIAMGRLFDRIESQQGMPKTVIYTLNPSSYYMISTMVGNFSRDIPGKMQLGAAWWFADHRDGIKEQLRVFANTGVLGLFNGMLTDSRSFTSYIRHDYFRRILCSLVGEWIEKGEYPNDMEAAGSLIRGICFDNAKNYFGL
jgi:glucuronate isomerase